MAEMPKEKSYAPNKCINKWRRNLIRAQLIKCEIGIFTNKIQYIPKAKYSKNAVELLRLRKYGLLTIGSDT